MTPEQWAALDLKVVITSVAIASPPVVNFKVTDANGAPVVGLETFTSKSSTATVASYPNLNFALSKLVPGVNKSADQWVSYIVTTVPTTTTAAAPTRPSTDNTGTLVGKGDGTYTYTFYRDVTTIKQQVDGMTVTGVNNKADLGDLTYDPTLQHRLVLQLSGAARGTGSNTPTGANSGIASVNLEKAVNALYDFVPATGATIAAGDQAKYVVDISSCNACHDRLAFHGGGARVDTQYCTVCHTTQRAYGRAPSTSTAYAFPANVSPAPTGIPAAPGLYETKTLDADGRVTSYGYSPAVYVGDGEVMGNFVTMIHKIHQGGTLVKTNYNYANVAFNLKAFSMLEDGQRMCTVCHDSAKAPKADLAYAKPTRQSCGACHDGINFATGAGRTLADNAAPEPKPQTGHIGRAQPDDSLCDACHQAATTKIDHRTINLTKHNPAVTDGLANFTYEIKEAKVNSTTNDLTIEFRILSAIAPSATKNAVTFVAPAAGVTNPLAGFTGSPSFLLAFAVAQDGIAAPADYNNIGSGSGNAQPRSVSIANLLNTNNAANGKLEPAATAGYYVATIYGAGAWAMPAAAKMRTVALQGYFTQVTPAAARHTISAVKTVTGDTERRKVVNATKCASCHEWFEGHGGNRVIGVETGANELVCVACHVPAIATSGRGVSDTTMQTYAWTPADLFALKEWGVDRFAPNAALQLPVTSNNMKDMIHGIHAGHDRVVPFQDARDRTSVIVLLDFRRMAFPGTLSNCEGCHNAGTYSSVPGGALVSRHEAIDAAYAAAITAGTATPALAKASLASQSPTDNVVTPFAAACVSCHDSSAAKGHMLTNGAKLFVPRSEAQGSLEACRVCHGPGSEWDAATVHK